MREKTVADSMSATNVQSVNLDEQTSMWELNYIEHIRNARLVGKLQDLCLYSCIYYFMSMLVYQNRKLKFGDQKMEYTYFDAQMRM